MRPAAKESRKSRSPAAAPRKMRAPVGLPMPVALLDATTVPDVIRLPPRKVLAFVGKGPPEGEPFQRGVGALYGIAYTLRFARKADDAAKDFKIGPLEARWSASVGAVHSAAPPPRESWIWELRIAVPDDVTDGEVGAAIRSATTKKRGKLAGSVEAGQVRLARLPEQLLGRALHVGPYASEPETFTRIHDALAAAGLAPARSHIEVYLSDPRRTAPARCKTVLLRELT
jgi:hypothetical protein